MIVGDDVLGVPFIKIHYALRGRAMHAPTGLVLFLKLMPVGEDIILPCMTIPP